MAVGKGGDINKWVSAKLSVVFGIDVSRDNIENRMDGACARYLRKKRDTAGNLFRGMFVQGNSSVNIRNADAIGTEKEKQITRAMFGEGGEMVNKLGTGVEDLYGVGADGFDVCSIQFAVHYMFESPQTLHQFLRNVSETTKVGGHFIGTSYDGSEVFKLLKRKDVGESAVVMEGDEKLWEVTKQYDSDAFDADESCVGYAIDVYQDSINKMFREYLVNYDYLTRLMENYGFVPIDKAEANRMGMPSGSGLFYELHQLLMKEIKVNPRAGRNYGSAPHMTYGERQISFLNRYFIFKKIRAVDAEQVAYSLMQGEDQSQSVQDQADEEESKGDDQADEEGPIGVEESKGDDQAEQPQAEQPQAPAKKPRKLKRKIVIRKKNDLNGSTT